MKMNNESGRSMVEMLGVLAIIGVLSIGGIAGYTIAMNRYRANEIIDTGTKLCVIAMTKNATTGEAGEAKKTEDLNIASTVNVGGCASEITATTAAGGGAQTCSIVVTGTCSDGVKNAVESVMGVDNGTANANGISITFGTAGGGTQGGSGG